MGAHSMDMVPGDIWDDWENAWTELQKEIGEIRGFAAEFQKPVNQGGYASKWGPNNNIFAFAEAMWSHEMQKNNKLALMKRRRDMKKGGPGQASPAKPSKAHMLISEDKP